MSAFLSASALAITDGMVCRLPYAPGLPPGADDKPRLVMIEGVSRSRPLVSFYGHQVAPLAKSLAEKPGAFVLDAPDSRYFFKLDTERLRLVVAVKTEGNHGGRDPATGEGVAGNCSPL